MKFLLTAGPTREPLDPVRYLSNRSSGKMGYALAEAAQRAGHEVVLISGPSALARPGGVHFLQVETAQEMLEAVRAAIVDMDCAIFAAAVADYRPAKCSDQKIKKSADGLTLELERTPDILGSMRAHGYRGTLVGFAAETENLLENARGKLVKKGCDLIVANEVSQSGIGFDAEDNAVTLVYANGREEAIAKMSKRDLAEKLIGVCANLVK